MPRARTDPGHSARYNWDHRRERARRMAYLRAHPGWLTCPRCLAPVFPHEDLHLDHDSTGTGYLPGLSHARDNTQAGGRVGNARRWRGRPGPTRSVAVNDWSTPRRLPEY